MAIDLNTNTQYTALKQSYDSQIDNIEDVKQKFATMGQWVDQWEQMTPGSDEYNAMQEKYDALANEVAKLDPDLSIRNQINAGKDPDAALKQQEADALGALATTLIHQDDVTQANAAAAAAKSGPVHGTQDIMTRAMAVFAQLSDATDGVSNNYMDIITGNVDQITNLNASSQTVRGLRPTGKPTDTCTINGADMDKLTNGGVTIPSDLKPDGSGNYTVSQADCDTLLNNIQSQSSSLTTLNQNTTISLNKSIDVGQQCSQFQTSELEKWSQLMSKILS